MHYPAPTPVPAHPQAAAYAAAYAAGRAQGQVAAQQRALALAPRQNPFYARPGGAPMQPMQVVSPAPMAPGYGGGMGAAMPPQAAAPHACGVQVGVADQELEALYRGAPGTFIKISGVNQCGQVIEVTLQKVGQSLAGLSGPPPAPAQQGPDGFDGSYDPNLNHGGG